MSISQWRFDDSEIERKALEAFNDSLESFVADAAHLWRWSDGDGGYVFDRIREALVEHQPWALPPRRDITKKTNRRRIPASVRASVYERDGYRCVVCGTQKSLSLDHIKPYSLGGSDDADNLQTMCRPHNSAKGARV